MILALLSVNVMLVFFFQISCECQLKTNVSAIHLQQFILLLAVIISSVSINILQSGFNIDFHFP